MINYKRLFFAQKQNIGQFIEKHAVMLTFALCLFLTPFSFMRQQSIDPGNIFFAWGLLVAFSAAALYLLNKIISLKVWVNTTIFIAAMLFSWMWLRLLHVAGGFRSVYVAISIMIALTAWFSICLVTKKITFKTAVLYIFLMSFCVRLCYVLATDISLRQHDFYGFWADDGHGGYIKYIYEHNFKLYDGDPTYVDQFYHPPLHYFICAVWWKILSLFGVLDEYSHESVQMLTLFYSSVCIIMFYKILDQFKLGKTPTIIAFIILAFHPTFIIFAGSINNDVLSVTFMTVALYFAIKWYKEQKLSNIIFCALAIGLGMLTKMSAYLICVPVGFIFLVRFLKDVLDKPRESIEKYAVQFSLFLLICAPLALFWSVRNYLKFNIPFTYVQQVQGNEWQYLGDYSFFERVFLLSPKQFSSVYDMWTNKGAQLYNEYNPMISLLKTAMFGEYINDVDVKFIRGFGELLYINSILLALLSVAAAVYCAVMAFKKRKQLVFKLTMLISHVFMLLFYYYFCFKFPNHCSMNIRYVSLLILSGVSFIAFALNDMEKFAKPKVYKVFSLTALTLTMIFALLSTLSYFAVSIS